MMDPRSEAFITETCECFEALRREAEVLREAIFRAQVKLHDAEVLLDVAKKNYLPATSVMQ